MSRPCPNCGKPLEDGDVYCAGIGIDNYRTIPPTRGRGDYCDHIPRTVACEIGSVQDGNTIRVMGDVTKIEDRTPLLVANKTQMDPFRAAGIDTTSMKLNEPLP